MQNLLMRKISSYFQLISYFAGIFNSFVFDFLIRTRVSMNLSFFYIYQAPIPGDITSDWAKRIIKFCAILNSVDNRFDGYAKAVGAEVSRLRMRDRIELTAELNAYVAKLYGLGTKDLEIVLNSFQGFKEDESILKMEGEIKWNDDLIRKFNGEVRKRVLGYFEKL